jgi:hypothetical protein
MDFLENSVEEKAVSAADVKNKFEVKSPLLPKSSLRNLSISFITIFFIHDGVLRFW